MAAEPTTRELTDLLAEFGPDRGHVLPALHKVQEHYGYVPRRAFDIIARQLRTTPAMIYGAASFYTDFRTVPPPEHTIDWCSGPACRLKGGDRIREAMEHTLEIPLGEQSDDDRVGFRVGQCNGTCTEAPQVWVDGRVVGRLTVASAIRLARKFREDA